MDNIKTILDAWVRSFNPSEKEQILADKRKDICLGCEHYKEFFKDQKWSAKCDACGCPISKKVFTKQFNPCPLKKWEDVDVDYYYNGVKKDRTLL